jgi:hypothetical protein
LSATLFDAPFLHVKFNACIIYVNKTPVSYTLTIRFCVMRYTQVHTYTYKVSILNYYLPEMEVTGDFLLIHPDFEK